jgi:hypothetical protein
MACGAFKLAVVCKPGLSLVAVSSAGDSLAHLRQQLEFLYGQIVFLLTNKVRGSCCLCGFVVATLCGPCSQPVLTLLTTPSFDLRGLLGGTTGMLDGVLRAAQRSLSVCFCAVPVLPLAQPSRNRAIAAMKCLAVPDVLYVCPRGVGCGLFSQGCCRLVFVRCRYAVLLAGDEIVGCVQPKSREFNLLSFGSYQHVHVGVAIPL